ncbi:hypothetical protein LTR53_003851 [Teratosphaeriaceae sp. CCFEE 6253]|nr:hypothetical protein LTR53_003851 [Teratosphaeriaceae sp. CCFEE 6253]
MADTLDPSLRATPPPAATPKTSSPPLDNAAMEQLARAALPDSSAYTAPIVPATTALRPAPQMRMFNAPRQALRTVPAKTRSKAKFRALAPAPPSQAAPEEPPAPLTIFDLPAELRVEIYKLVLENVIIHILPLNSTSRHCPHALICTSRQVRNEVLPLIHSTCRIRANVTDFDFGGMLAWMARIPPSQQAHLCKNDGLQIMLCTTSAKPADVGQEMRKWLHQRADPYRPQPGWKYKGAPARREVASDLRRRVKRMTEEGKRAELTASLGGAAMAATIGVTRQ